METLEQLKEIESNQPEDRTAQIYDGEYWKQTENLVFYVWSNVRGFYEWVPDAPKDLYSLRSLSDIERIIELMEGQKKAYQAYVALEEIKQKYNGENKIAKELLKLAYECDEFALSGDLRKDIKEFLGDL